MKSQAIVTLADSNYFELLLELISSIKQFDQSKDVAICILDAGLTEKQIEILKEKVEDTILQPILNAMKNEGHPFKGFLYIGLMIVNNDPYVIEFNVRLGDPETQVLLPLFNSSVDTLCPFNFSESYISKAVRSPFPRTSFILSGNSLCMFSKCPISCAPRILAFSANFSSTKTLIAYMPTTAPRGYPPNVDPSDPGVKTSITSFVPATKETGNIPPPAALPHPIRSGLIL